MRKSKFLVVGGDMRNLLLAEQFMKDDMNVEIYGFSKREKSTTQDLRSAVKSAEVIIGPVPCCSSHNTLNTPFNDEPIYIDELFGAMNEEQIFIAGRIYPEVLEIAGQKGVMIFDLLERGDMAILNAIPTAEGAIQIALEEMQITLHESHVMVLGFGRVGKMLAKMLNGIGAKVFVVTRRLEDAASVRSYGYNSLFYEDLPQTLGDMNLIINTVPHVVLGKHNLKFANRDCLIIDLASKPFGVDYEASKNEGLKVMWAPSLPGKTAPITAAGYIKQTVYNILNEAAVNT
jgi:dipicolinate synthase subunit A